MSQPWASNAWKSNVWAANMWRGAGGGGGWDPDILLEMAHAQDLESKKKKREHNLAAILTAIMDSEAEC